MGSFLSSQSRVPSARSSAAPAATAPSQWMVLAPYGRGRAEACNITADSETIAAAATSNGEPISVSLRREPFPALSRILCFRPSGDRWPSCTVIAAHGGYVLLQISSKTRDCFVYNNVGSAAADSARPPTLYLIPGRLDVCATGLLCCGEAEFVVAQLTVVPCMHDVAARARHIEFELRLFRHGEWCVKRPWFMYGNGMNRKELWAQWEAIAVVPLGNGMLCWVDRYSGVIFSDVLEEGPKLRYVPYPPEAVLHQRYVCTDVRGALKLVSITPHRCTHCCCSEHATDIDIWTLNTDDMAWVLETKTNMVDSTELWEIPDRPGYARAHLVYPVASMNGGGNVVTGRSGGGDNASDDKHDVSEESAVPMEKEEDEHTNILSLPASLSSSASPLADSMVRRSTRTTSKKDGFHEVRLDREPSKKRKTCPVLLINPETGEAGPIPLDILQAWGIDRGI